MLEDSHTYREILSQPAVWKSTLDAFCDAQMALRDLLDRENLDQVITAGCGSTHYLAQSAATTIIRRSGIPAHAFPSSELWLFPGVIPTGRALLLAISRSGATTETLRASERFRQAHRGPVVVITCYPQSPLARQADLALVALDAQEQSVAQTRSFSSMLLLAQAFAAVLAHDEERLERLNRLPPALKDLEERLGDLPQRLGANVTIEQFFFLGSGPLYGIANEVMLKTKEMSLSRSEAYHPLEFRHGPMSVVDERTLVVGLLSDTAPAEELRVLEDMSKLGARTLVLVEDSTVFAHWRPDTVVELQSGLDEWERGPLCLVALQWLAYYRAVAKGLNPDRPTHLTAVIEL